jgi:hypothetical protein
MEKPAAFPQTLEIETTDFHIPSAPATIANIEIQKPKRSLPQPAYPPSFRLIFRLEKTMGLSMGGSVGPNPGWTETAPMEYVRQATADVFSLASLPCALLLPHAAIAGRRANAWSALPKANVAKHRSRTE